MSNLHEEKIGGFRVDVQLINNAFLHGLTVEIIKYGGVIGSGKILEHTKETIRLDDGMYYYKSMYDVRIK